MPRADREQLIKGTLASLAFIAVGLFMRWVGAPGLAIWPSVAFGAVGLAGAVYRIFKPMAPDVTGGSGVVLRDGRDYRVAVADDGFALTHKSLGEEQRMAWDEVTFVAAIAIDNFPIGGISFMVHRSARELIQVPWDAEGGRAFLAMMADKLPGFDNAAVIAASGMLHGFKQLWPPEVTTATVPPG